MQTDDITDSVYVEQMLEPLYLRCSRSILPSNSPQIPVVKKKKMIKEQNKK